MRTKQWIGSVVLIGIITLVPLWGVTGALADTESPEETATTDGATNEETEDVGNQQEAETDAGDSSPEATATTDDRGDYPDAGASNVDDSHDSAAPESVVADDPDGSEEGDLAGADTSDNEGDDGGNN